MARTSLTQNPSKALSDALLKEQERRGINQSAAAKIIGVNRNVYNRWVSGREVFPAWQNVAAVADFLHCTNDEVLAMYPDPHALRGARGKTHEFVRVIDEVRELRAEIAALSERFNTYLAAVNFPDASENESARPRS